MPMRVARERRMPAHELESAGIMFEVKRRASELMQTPLVLETDSEASAQMRTRPRKRQQRSSSSSSSSRGNRTDDAA